MFYLKLILYATTVRFEQMLFLYIGGTLSLIAASQEPAQPGIQDSFLE